MQKPINKISLFLPRGCKTFKAYQKQRNYNDYYFFISLNVVGKLLKIISREKILHIATFRSDRLSKRDSKISRFRTLIFKNFVLIKIYLLYLIQCLA
ncbi:hypothetical protein CM15mP35_07960 [bacterium]|nr:MAG: hypothetical protein CM15mP35_07960 [bacterium]